MKNTEIGMMLSRPTLTTLLVTSFSRQIRAMAFVEWWDSVCMGMDIY
jgi:hypothetical protein